MEVELGVAVVLAEGQAEVELVAAEPVEEAAVQEDPEPVQEAQAAAEQLEEVQEPGQAAAMGSAPVLVRLQGQASDRGLPLRSVLVLMRPLALALAPQLVRVRLAVPGWVPALVRRSVLALEVPSVKEPVTGLVTGPGTKVPGLKMEPVLERLRSDRQDRIKEQSGTSSVTLCSLI